MPCYYPVSAYRSWTINPKTGKRGIVFNGKAAMAGGREGEPLWLSCGQCIGCRLERSRQWAVRCMHEASLYDRNCFITLTYDDEHLPVNGSLPTLVKADFQKFMKRLRKEYGSGVRYYQCGEYGDVTRRPHYHACLFNFDFDDKVVIKENELGKLCISEKLQKLWPYGFSTIGDVTFESAAYVARYIVKKQLGEKAVFVYNEIDNRTGEILSEQTPEYTTMSRRPGIGRGWYEKFTSDVFPRDYVVVRGHKSSVPKYYNAMFEVANPTVMCEIKNKRQENFKKDADRQWEETRTLRLLDREEFAKLKLKQLKREI